MSAPTIQCGSFRLYASRRALLALAPSWGQFFFFYGTSYFEKKGAWGELIFKGLVEFKNLTRQ
jgi:hypothetical protein